MVSIINKYVVAAIIDEIRAKLRRNHRQMSEKRNKKQVLNNVSSSTPSPHTPDVHQEVLVQVTVWYMILPVLRKGGVCHLSRVDVDVHAEDCV